jgi:hypothetical protein
MSAAQEQIKLSQLNSKLTQARLPSVHPSKLQTVLENCQRDKLLRAINNLDNPNAHEYLRRVLVRAEIPFDQTFTASNQADQSEAEGLANQSDDDSLLNQRAKFHVYGRRAALCFEVDVTRGGVPTIALDAANCINANTYNWAKKTRIQMTRAELPVVAAVLLGSRASCEFKAHGPDKSKGFALERQAGGKVFAKVMDKDQPMKAVPIEAADAFYVASLFLLQIRRGSPWLDAVSTIALINATQKH